MPGMYPYLVSCVIHTSPDFFVQCNMQISHPPLPLLRRRARTQDLIEGEHLPVTAKLLDLAYKLEQYIRHDLEWIKFVSPLDRDDLRHNPSTWRRHAMETAHNCVGHSCSSAFKAVLDQLASVYAALRLVQEGKQSPGAITSAMLLLHACDVFTVATVPEIADLYTTWRTGGGTSANVSSSLTQSTGFAGVLRAAGLPGANLHGASDSSSPAIAIVIRLSWPPPFVSLCLHPRARKHLT